MNLDKYEIAVLKILIEQKIEMPQYEDLNIQLNAILEKLNNYEVIQ
jgi:hypothetical protein